MTSSSVGLRNCASCHGDDRRPGAAVALADPVYLAIVDDDTLRGVTADGVPGTAMPAFAQRGGGPLTDEQLGLLVADIRARWARPDALGGTAPPPRAAPLGDVRCGGEVYASAARAATERARAVDPSPTDRISVW